MSPLQFQKRSRLNEVRRRLLSENLGVAQVALEVGNDSPSRFSREYRRMFGAPQVQDTKVSRSKPMITTA
jgi:transcriptional regulator GlxA family with amidase domain